MLNEDLLIWCKEPQFAGQYMEPAPPLDIINEEEEYEVEEIKKHWKRGWGTQFLVHWKGYLMQKRWLKIIGHEFWVKIYKKKGKIPNQQFQSIQTNKIFKIA